MKGQTGIGALIVFIAFVLTAAIAAFLVTQTTIATQSKAAAVADQARERTGTTFEVVRVEGLVNNTTGAIDKFILYVRLAPGSSPVNLNTTTIAYYTADGRNLFTYSDTVDNESAANTTYDGYFYLIKSLSAAKDGNPDIIFEPGELYAIWIVARNDTVLQPSDWWRFSLIPKEGQPAEVYGIAPDVFVGSTVVLR